MGRGWREAREGVGGFVGHGWAGRMGRGGCAARSLWGASCEWWREVLMDGIRVFG